MRRENVVVVVVVVGGDGGVFWRLKELKWAGEEVVKNKEEFVSFVVNGIDNKIQMMITMMMMRFLLEAANDEISVFLFELTKKRKLRLIYHDQLFIIVGILLPKRRAIIILVSTTFIISFSIVVVVVFDDKNRSSFCSLIVVVVVVVSFCCGISSNGDLLLVVFAINSLHDGMVDEEVTEVEVTKVFHITSEFLTVIENCKEELVNT